MTVCIRLTGNWLLFLYEAKKNANKIKTCILKLMPMNLQFTGLTHGKKRIQKYRPRMFITGRRQRELKKCEFDSFFKLKITGLL